MVTVACVNAFVDPAVVPAPSGNPAGVVLSAPVLSDAAYLAIAKAVGYSETVFVFGNIATGLTLRYFTPVAEVPFCGHATLAALALLQQQGIWRVHEQPCLTFATGVGPLRMAYQTLTGALWMQQCPPVFGPCLSREEIAASLNVPPSALSATLPPQVVSTGLPDVMVPVKDRETLNALQPNLAAVSAISRREGVVGYHVFCMPEEGSLPSLWAHCRNLAPLLGIEEEAATGSASGALAAYLWQHKAFPVGAMAEFSGAFAFEQGLAMGFPSHIEGSLQVGDTGVEEVWVGGHAVAFQTLQVPHPLH